MFFQNLQAAWKAFSSYLSERVVAVYFVFLPLSSHYILASVYVFNVYAMVCAVSAVHSTKSAV